MRFRSSAPTLLLLLLCLCLLGGVLEVKGQYLQEALSALDLPGDEPRLQKNHTGVLITKLLQVVHCAERTGTSQDICGKVWPVTVSLHDKLSNLYIHMLTTVYVFITFLPAYSKKSTCYHWNVSECRGLSP